MVSTEERIKALATYLGVEEDEITEGYRDDIFEVNGEEYLVVNEDEAYGIIVDDIENLIDDIGLAAFTESMQDWIVKNAVGNTEWFDEALEEDMNYYVDDLSDDEVVENAIDYNVIDEDDAYIEDEDGNEEINPDLDIEDLGEKLVQALIDEQDDAYTWYVDNFGKNSVRDLIKDGTLTLDYQAIADEVISWDGRGNSLASYDGDEIELDNGLYAYRLN